MARIDVDGLEIDYEWIGDPRSPPLMLTPGGRYPRDTAGVPELGERLATGGFRVLLWDRPGCGASDVAFTAPSESVMNAEAGAGLIRALALEDVTLVGGSAGSRVSLMVGVRMPGNIRQMAIWWPSGGPVGLAGLAWFYCGDQVTACAKGGMEAVARLPSWAEQIGRNPRVRDILLRQDPDMYITTMQTWAAAFQYRPDTPMPGLSAADFARLTMPIMVFRSGKSDMSHTRRTSERLAELLPNAQLREPPWGDQEWNDVSSFPNDPANRRGRFERWPLIAPDVLAFFEGNAT